MSKSALFLFVLVVFITSACQLDVNSGSQNEEPLSQPTNMPTTSAAASATPLQTVSGQMVTDSRVGFTFNYPEGWTLYAPDDVSTAVAYAYTMQSSVPSEGGGGGPLPPNTTKIDLYVNPNDPTASFSTIQARIEQQDLESENLVVHSTETTRLENGMEALLVRGTAMGGDFVSLHILIKGYEVIVTALGDEQYFWDLVNSLRETN
jgi:hypothetical protein